MNDISSEFERITGLPPYRWQRRLVESGLPETLEIPTGCGKTEAVFMAWAYRRRGRGSIAACCASATICSRVSFPRPSGRGSIAAAGQPRGGAVPAPLVGGGRCRRRVGRGSQVVPGGGTAPRVGAQGGRGGAVPTRRTHVGARGARRVGRRPPGGGGSAPGRHRRGRALVDGWRPQHYRAASGGCSLIRSVAPRRRSLHGE